MFVLYEAIQKTRDFGNKDFNYVPILINNALKKDYEID